LGNSKDFRRDSFIQEQTAEYQLRYLGVFNASSKGTQLKERIGQLAWGIPLLPKMGQDTFPDNILLGPFSGTDSEGHPLIEPRSLETVYNRMNPGAQRKPPIPSTPIPQAKPEIK
jgi:hypothetical protein